MTLRTITAIGVLGYRYSALSLYQVRLAWQIDHSSDLSYPSLGPTHLTPCMPGAISAFSPGLADCLTENTRDQTAKTFIADRGTSDADQSKSSLSPAVILVGYRSTRPGRPLAILVALLVRRFSRQRRRGVSAGCRHAATRPGMSPSVATCRTAQTCRRGERGGPTCGLPAPGPAIGGGHPAARNRGDAALLRWGGVGGGQPRGGDRRQACAPRDPAPVDRWPRRGPARAPVGRTTIRFSVRSHQDDGGSGRAERLRRAGSPARRHARVYTPR